MNAVKTSQAGDFQLTKLIVPGVVMLAFWGIAVWAWLASGNTQPLIMFGYIGTSIGVGLGLYATLPKRRKPVGRRLTVFLVGLFLVGFGVFIGHENAQQAVIWFIAGIVAYWAIGIGLAYALKDNRAFCKYVCPVSVPLKVTSRFALLKIAGDTSKCNDCGACTKMCPMDIRIPEYVKRGERVLSTECSLCQTCTTVCAKDALKLSFGFDAAAISLRAVGGNERLRLREPAPEHQATVLASAGQ